MVTKLKGFPIWCWGWLNFKLAVLMWITALMLVPPTPVADAVGAVLLYAWGGITMIGTLISVVGLFTAQQTDRKVASLGMAIEQTGLWLMLVGPLTYFFTQASLLLSDLETQFQSRFALVFMAWVVVSSIIARLVVVIRHRQREAKEYGGH